jgi:hypothetical protein
MSRGPGRIQQAVLDLIEDHPDEAWLTAHVCGYMYGMVGRSQRVAVARALRTMNLPPLWGLTNCWLEGSERCVYNTGSVESILRMEWYRRDYWHTRTVTLCEYGPLRGWTKNVLHCGGFDYDDEWKAEHRPKAEESVRRALAHETPSAEAAATEFAESRVQSPVSRHGTTPLKP